jgi:hypothetical protein
MSLEVYKLLATLSGPFLVFWDEYSWNQAGPGQGDYGVIYWGIALVLGAATGGVLIALKKKTVGTVVCVICGILWLLSGFVIAGIGV